MMCECCAIRSFYLHSLSCSWSPRWCEEAGECGRPAIFGCSDITLLRAGDHNMSGPRIDLCGRILVSPPNST